MEKWSTNWSVSDLDRSKAQGKSADLLLKVKDRVNILEVIGEHVVLRKAGANHSGLCPFHSERTPSFSVSESKQVYHCYGCKRGGDLVTFVMEIQGISFSQALEELADRARVALPEGWRKAGTSSGPNAAEASSVAYKLNRFAAAFFHHHLASNPELQNYFHSRGVDEELNKSFYLGGVSDSWDSLARHLIAKKAPLDVAVQLGLIRPSKNSGQPGGTGYYDLFRNRAIFPILNMRGKVAGFGGRILGDENPKYLNSPESQVYQKGKLAYGLYQAQKHIREKDEIILVEGYFDVLLMHAAGFKNAVATCGTALTPELLSIFKRLASKLIVLFDSDDAGISATDRAMETALDAGWVISAANLPKGLDPDEVLIDPTTKKITEEGKARMTAILSDSRPLLDARIDEGVQASFKSAEEKTVALKKIGGWLARFQDPVGRQVRLENLQKRIGISGDLMKKAMPPVPQKERPVQERPVVSVGHVPHPARQQGGVKLSSVEKIILGGIAMGGESHQILIDYRAKLPPELGIADLFEHPQARAWVAELLSQGGFLEQKRPLPEQLMATATLPEIRSVIAEALLRSSSEEWLDSFRGAVCKVLGRKWARFSQRIKTALVEAEIRKDTCLQTELMKEYLDVQRKMKDFSNFYDEE